jgi:hypothetical protein
MENRNVSPGLFAGAMVIVGLSIIKDPKSVFNLIWAGVLAKLEAFAIFMAGILKIGLCIVAVGLVLWLIVRIVCWFEDLERQRNWLQVKVQELLADITDLKRHQAISSNCIDVIERKNSKLNEALEKLTKSPAAKQQESKSASTAALSEIIGV